MGTNRDGERREVEGDTCLVGIKAHTEVMYPYGCNYSQSKVDILLLCRRFSWNTDEGVRAKL